MYIRGFIRTLFSLKSVSGIHTPIKHLKHLKWTRLFLIKGGGKYVKKRPWNYSRLEPVRFYGLTVFVSKNICIVKSLLVFCIVLQCFFIVILISVSNISPRIIMKRKSHGRRNDTTRYLRLKRCWKFSQKWDHQTSISLRASSLFWGSREKSRESSTRKETQVRLGQGERRVLSRKERLLVG